MNLTALRELAKRTLVDYEIASRHTEAGATLVTLARALLAALDVVEAAERIAEFRGQTLLGPDHDKEATRIYSTGANRAFEECAGIASAALARFKEVSDE